MENEDVKFVVTLVIILTLALVYFYILYIKRKKLKVITEEILALEPNLLSGRLEYTDLGDLEARRKRLLDCNHFQDKMEKFAKAQLAYSKLRLEPPEVAILSAIMSYSNNQKIKNKAFKYFYSHLKSLPAVPEKSMK
jgi:hypothetical protein